MKKNFKRKKLIIYGALLMIIMVSGILLFNGDNYNDLVRKHGASVRDEAHISSNYAVENKGEVLVETPEVYELVNVITALTEHAEQGRISINTRGDYYQKMIDHFTLFREHEAVKKMNDSLKRYGYSRTRLLFVYEFSGEEIVNNGIYQQPELKKFADEHIELIEDFAFQSNFRQFYKDNLPFYQEQIKSYKESVPVRQMWSWLEKNFPQRHDTYKVIISPLVGGSHNAHNFYDDVNDFSEIIMFVSGPYIYGRNNSVSKEVIEGLISRTVFTEIDHTYVNPSTDQKEYLKKVVKVFSDLDKWNNQGGYRRPTLTFNEYMTWGVFGLYAYDKYEPKDYQEIMEYTTALMKRRGFTKFEMFYDKLLDLYQNRDKDENVYDLYPAILKWAAEV